MDVSRGLSETERHAALSAALKTLRVRRGFRSVELARQMHVSHRTYQRFEAGESGIDLKKIFRFAQIVRADPWGIVFAAEFGSPAFALYCSENQAASLLVTMLRRFNRRSGQDIAALDPRSLVMIYGRSLAQITLRAQQLNADLEEWMFDEAFGDPDDEDPS